MIKNLTLNKQTFSVFNDLEVSINYNENKLDIVPDSMFAVAARNNPKRSFLFASKIIGKYLPVRPETPLIVGELLAHVYYEHKYGKSTTHIPNLLGKLAESRCQRVEHTSYKLKLPDPTIFVGFAETATALGHSVHTTFEDNSQYIHTTREVISGASCLLGFEEEHSHATSHMLYPLDTEMFNNANHIVFVEDEITTGNTLMNVMRVLQSKYPRCNYSVLTLLDWRSSADKEKCIQFAQEMGISLNIISLISGDISVKGKSPVVTDRDNINNLVVDDSKVHYYHVESEGMKGKCMQQNACGEYLYETARFGIGSEDNWIAESTADIVAKEIAPHLDQSSKILCLGTGEFMHLPLLISQRIKGDVVYMSTARSPMHIDTGKSDYPIRAKYAFPSPSDPGVTHHIYNVEPHMYDEAVIVVERGLENQDIDPMLSCMLQLINKVHIVYITGGKYDK